MCSFDACMDFFLIRDFFFLFCTVSCTVHCRSNIAPTAVGIIIGVLVSVVIINVCAPEPAFGVRLTYIIIEDHREKCSVAYY